MRKLSVLLTCLALGTTTLSATAQQDKKPAQPPAGGDRPQRGGGGGGGGQGGGMMRGQPLDPAKAKAAQTLQATGVAKHTGLNEAQTKSLITAYLAARESHGAAQAKMMQEMRDAAQSGDGERPDPQVTRQKMQDLNKSEREKFQAALGSTVSAEQGAKIMASLGSFNAQWDRWVDALSEFKLEPAKQQASLDAIETYVLALEKARGGDREAMQEANQAARETLNASLKKTLTEEQFTKFEATMRPGGRGQGGPGGPGGDAPRRRQRDGEAPAPKDGGK